MRRENARENFNIEQRNHNSVYIHAEQVRPSSSPLVLILHYTQVVPLKLMKNRTGTLLLQKVPEKIVIISSGVIRLETGSIWIRLGSKVVIIKFLNSIRGAGIDEEISYVYSIFQLFMC